MPIFNQLSLTNLNYRGLALKNHRNNPAQSRTNGMFRIPYPATESALRLPLRERGGGGETKYSLLFTVLGKKLGRLSSEVDSCALATTFSSTHSVARQTRVYHIIKPILLI